VCCTVDVLCLFVYFLFISGLESFKKNCVVGLNAKLIESYVCSMA
jgi:hypothetical protein